MTPVDAVAVIEALLLRAKLPELPLREGSAFLARVASRGDGGAASLVVAGELLTASVPEEVQAGQTLRLTVTEVSPERVLLRMEPQPPPSAAVAPPPPPPPADVRVSVEERAPGRHPPPGEAAVTLVIETPALGTVRLRVATVPGAVSATVQVPAAVHALAQARGERLRADLAAGTGRAASVQVVPGSVDLRA
jgi:hypothetical protein